MKYITSQGEFFLENRVVGGHLRVYAASEQMLDWLCDKVCCKVPFCKEGVDNFVFCYEFENGVALRIENFLRPEKDTITMLDKLTAHMQLQNKRRTRHQGTRWVAGMPLEQAWV